MILKGNEMTVFRGETFTMDRTVRNRDGSPFIVSDKYNNPYVLITVASSTLGRHDVYKANWWLSLEDLPTFGYTRPWEIAAFSTEITDVLGHGPGEYLYCVNGDKGYEYKYFTEDKNGNAVWQKYEFRIIHHFLHDITKDWVEGTYLYSIRLVAGQSMLEHLRALYEDVLDKEAPDNYTVDDLYSSIEKENAELVKNLIPSRPIANFDVVQDILSPTKLTVLPDLNGGLR